MGSWPPPRERQPDLDRGAASVRDRACRRDLAAMGIDDALGDRKPEAGAFAGIPAALARPHELLEYMGQNLRGDAGPVVGDDEHDGHRSARASSLMRAAAPP